MHLCLVRPGIADTKMGPVYGRIPFCFDAMCRGYLAATAIPACSARAAALSVASQVKSFSVRPKWP